MRRVIFFAAAAVLVIGQMAFGRPANVTDYGAVPDDGLDDTAAIQRALDENRGNYFNPGGQTDPGGGVVFIPRGLYHVTGLKLYSSTHVKGEPGTNVIGTGDAPTFTLTSHFGHGGITHVQMTGLCITSLKSHCVDAPNGVTNGAFRDLNVGGALTCLNFTGYTQHTTIENIYVSQTGSGAVFLAGNANKVLSIDTEGGVNPLYKWRKPEAMVVVHGPPAGAPQRSTWDWSNADGNKVESCIIEGGYRCAAFSFSGIWTHYRNNWIEMDNGGDPPVIIDGARWCDFDFLYDGVRITNSDNVGIGEFFLQRDTLRAAFDIDATSTVSINQLSTYFDGGAVDDPQIHVQRVSSMRGHTVIDRAPFRTQLNWAAPTSNTNGAYSAYVAVPGQAWAPVASRVTVKPDRSGWCTEFTISEADAGKQVVVPVKMAPPTFAVGGLPYAQWRADAPAGVNLIVYQQGWGDQFACRGTNGLTVTRVPAPLKIGDYLYFNFYNAKPGTYRLSDVRVAF